MSAKGLLSDVGVAVEEIDRADGDGTYFRETRGLPILCPLALEVERCPLRFPRFFDRARLGGDGTSDSDSDSEYFARSLCLLLFL